MTDHYIVMSLTAARDLAETCTADDEDGWQYLVKEIAGNRAIVEVFDNEGFRLGAL